MKRAILAAGIVLLMASVVPADEIRVDSHIDAVELFKNGLAIVHRSAAVNGPGVYRIEDVPAPVHGTFSVDGDVPVEVHVTMRDVDAPAVAGAGIDFQHDLVGQQVTIRLRDANLPPISGKVLQFARLRGEDAWSRTYQQSQNGYDQTTLQGLSQYLQLETKDGRIYLDSSLIAFLSVDSTSTIKQRRPVMLLTLGSDQKGPGFVHISYLTKGVSWAPSYRMNLVDDKNLVLEQTAVIKNELADMSDVDISLISGYPNMRFSQVLSPLSLTQNWAKFFAQITQNPAEVSSALSNNGPVSQNTVNQQSGLAATGIDVSATPYGEGSDIRYQPIGKRTLAEGDSLTLSVARGTAPYERIVEWVVPDARDDDGVNNYYGNGGQREPSPGDSDAAWDAIRFKNPLPFAMTTAPVMILEGGRFAAQNLTYWANQGEQSTLQTTKALSIRTRAVETEDQNTQRTTVAIGLRIYHSVTVTGTLTMTNNRAQAINMIIRRRFSGNLVKADGDPKLVLLEQEISAINHRNELTWTLPLASGEGKTLTYQYTLLLPG